MSAPHSTYKLDVHWGADDARGLGKHSVEVVGERPATYKPLFLTTLKGIMNLMVLASLPGSVNKQMFGNARLRQTRG